MGDIKFRNENTWGTWHNAVCMKRGSILNIRDIEQTIDNFNNVPSQSADIKIEPGSKEGESNLVIDIKRTKPWTLMTSVDNSGTKTTGRAQMSATLQLLQPFSANDVFYASWNRILNPAVQVLAQAWNLVKAQATAFLAVCPREKCLQMAQPITKAM